MEHILKHEENSKLGEHGLPCRERNLPGRHSKVLCHGVEQPDLAGKKKD